MAATYSKPTDIPRWADTTAHVLEPPSGKKDEGWVLDEFPPSNYENWRTREVGRWFKWLNERLFDGFTADSFAIDYPVDGSRAILFGDNLDTEINCLELWVTTKSGSAATGSVINFWNPNRVGDAKRWRVVQSSERLKISSYNAAAVFEFNHLQMFPSGGQSILETDQDAVFRPASGGTMSRLGQPGNEWNLVHTENLIELDKAYLFGQGASNITVNWNGIVITPQTEIISNDINVDGSGQMTFNKQGVYLVNVTIQVRTITATIDPATFFWRKNGGASLAGSLFAQKFLSTTDEHVIAMNYMIEVTNTSDYWELFADHNTSGETFVVDEDTSMTVTCVRTDV